MTEAEWAGRILEILPLTSGSGIFQSGITGQHTIKILKREKKKTDIKK